MEKDYGSFLKMHRLNSGYTSCRRFSEVCKISAATISRIESNIQKPEVSTLKKLAPYLTSTSLKEMLSYYDYIEESDYMNENDRFEFIKVHHLLDIDGEPLTKAEKEGILAYVRSLRLIKEINQKELSRK